MRTAIRMRANGDVRRRAGSLTAVALTLGVLGTVAMGGVAGARRTEAAYPAYREATRQPEVQFVSCASGSPYPYVDIAKVAALPGVESVSRGLFTPVAAKDLQGNMLSYAPNDPFETNLIIPRQQMDWQPKLLAGRYPDPASPDEVLVSWSTSQKYPGPQVGSTIDMTLPTAALLNGGPPSPAETDRVHVVGEIITPFSLNGGDTSIVTTPAFLAKHPATGYGNCDFAIVQLSGGAAATPAFMGRLQAIAPAVTAGTVQAEVTFFARATHLKAVVYALFGLLVGLLALTLVGQALVRRTQLATLDDPVLRTIGMTRGQRFWSAFLPGAAAGVVGTALAVIGAILVSAAFPTGVARMIDPAPGILVDPRIIGLGAAIMLAGTLGATAVPAWRGSRAKGPMTLGTAEFAGRSSGSRTAAALSRAGAPATAIAGARFALEPGRGRTSVPVRSAIIGLAIAIAAVSGGLVFAASMNRFQTDPTLRGGFLDIGTGHPFIGALFQDHIVPVFVDDPQISGLTVGNFQNQAGASGPAGDTNLTIWALSPVRGAVITPTVLQGKWPAAPDEIILGKQSARALGVGIGDRVTLTSAMSPATYRVVGFAVFPEEGFGPGLGDGAGMSMEGLYRLFPKTTATQNLVFAQHAPGTQTALVAKRLTSEIAAMCAALPSDSGCPWGIQVNAPKASSSSFQDLSGAPGASAIVKSKYLPLALALLFALAAAATLIHVLVTSIRRRRRDVSILKTLGFNRRQVIVTIEWQATLLAVVACLVGVPLGVLIGRWGWALFADQLGIGVAIVVPWVQVLLILPVVVALALIIAAAPAFAASRTKAAVVLRTE